MRNPLLGLGIVMLGWVALAVPAWAGEWIESDGYRFRLPDGYVGVDAGQAAAGSRSLSLEIPGQGGSGVELDVRAWARDYGSTEQAVLVVSRTTFTGEAADQLRAQASSQALMQKLRDGMSQASAALGARGAELEESRTIPLGAGHEAFEVRVRASDAVQRDQIVRMAFATYEDSVYVFLLSGAYDARHVDDAAWAGVTTSMRLTSVGGIGRFLRHNWPYLAGGVLLVLLLGLWLRGREPAPTYRGRTSYATDRAPAVLGMSRAMDGLPTYDAPDDLYGTADAPRPASPRHEPLRRAQAPPLDVPPDVEEREAGAAAAVPTPEEAPVVDTLGLDPGAVSSALSMLQGPSLGPSTRADAASRPVHGSPTALGGGDETSHEPPPAPWGGAVEGGSTKRKIPLSKASPPDGARGAGRPSRRDEEAEKPRIQRNRDFMA